MTRTIRIADARAGWDLLSLPRRRVLLQASVISLSLFLAVGAFGQTVTTLAVVDSGSGGITVGPDGSVYTSDFGPLLGNSEVTGTRVHRVSPDGKAQVFAEGLNGASGSEWGADGSFYQSNIRGNLISKIAADGTVSDFATEGFQNPVGIVQRKDGSFLVANCGSASIQLVALDGTSSRLVQTQLLACPNGIALDDDENAYVANFSNGNLVRITPQGEASVHAELPGNNNGHVFFREGTLWVVARSAHQIYRVSLDGKVELFAGTGEKGGKDGPALDSSFCYPNDLGFSPDGRYLYVNEVADETSEGQKLGPTRIRRIEMKP